MTIKKNSFRNWQLIPNFFIAHLPILVRCKTKGAVGKMCALLRNWQLGANCQLLYEMTGKERKGDGRIFFLKTSTPLFFNDVLSNDPNFGRIHLAGLYL
jgi:hypothetical protein